MEEKDLKELFKKFLKESVQISTFKKEYKSECSYSSYTFIQLLVDGEVISSCEIEDLTK